jgi:hypothetical protein
MNKMGINSENTNFKGKTTKTKTWRNNLVKRFSILRKKIP